VTNPPPCHDQVSNRIHQCAGSAVVAKAPMNCEPPVLCACPGTTDEPLPTRFDQDGQGQSAIQARRRASG
jgi:hypothetical protein